MVALIIALLEQPRHVDEVKSCLEAAGHVVLAVANFENAKIALQDNTVDLIISDVHLENGGSVFDFLKWVRSREDLRTIPFVLFSLEPTKIAKYLADAVRTAARQMGATKYISMETFDSSILREEIEELLPLVSPKSLTKKEGE